MKKRMVFLGAFFVSAVAASSSVKSETTEGFFDDSALSVRAEVGVGGFNAGLSQQEGRQEDGSKLNHGMDFVYTDLSVGLTYFVGRYFLDGYVRTALTVHDFDLDVGRGQTISRSSDMDRTEINATVGYQLTETLTGFLGVRSESTKGKQKADSDFLVAVGFDELEIDTIGITAGLRGGKVVGRHVWAGGGGVTKGRGEIRRDSEVTGVRVSETKDTWGVMLVGQYRYLINPSWDFSVSTDLYYLDFGSVRASDGSRYRTDVITGSVRMGLNYTF